MAREQSFFDQAANAFRGVVDDIRAKLIDEAWFGRRAAPPGQFDGVDLGWVREPAPNIIRSADDLAPRPTFEALWAPGEPGREPVAHDQEMDFER
jgi:hypothetical protein